jgi:hypothetical protein
LSAPGISSASYSSVEEFTAEFLVVWPEDEERLNP